MPIEPGAQAPPLPGAEVGDGPAAIVFYKVTCSTCQLAAPAMERLSARASDRFVAVAQDPPPRVQEFAGEYGVTFPSLVDTEPYDVSNAYGIRTVPTVFLVDGGRVEDVVEAWDREAWNRVTRRLGELTGQDLEPVSEEGDGLPPFKPG